MSLSKTLSLTKHRSKSRWVFQNILILTFRRERNNKPELDNDASGPCLCVYWLCDIYEDDRWTNRRVKSSKWGSKNMLADHLFQCRISPWPKTAEKRGSCTGVTDGRTDRLKNGQTNRRMDRPSYRDTFLTDASKKRRGVSIIRVGYLVLRQRLIYLANL